MSFHKQPLALLISATLLLGLATPSLGQTQPPVFFVYIVNFECGFQVSDIGPGGYEPLVKVANYATKVDFTNYDLHPAQVQAEVLRTDNSRWAAATGPVALVPGNLAMGSNTATVIDCNHIAQAITGAVPAGKPFYSGMVRIVSDQELVVWTTKTTQVCAGLAKLDNGDPILPPLSYDLGSGLTYSTYSGQQEAVDLSIFGCPAAETVNGEIPNPPTNPGTFLGPSGGVPPGLRPIPGAISIVDGYQPGVPNQPSGFMMTNISVSHSMDSERVEGVCIND